MHLQDNLYQQLSQKFLNVLKGIIHYGLVRQLLNYVISDLTAETVP